MAIYIALFAVMWKYAPPDEEEEEDDADCCSLLSTSSAGNAGGPNAPGMSFDGESCA
jgi:hypothetical protein